MNVLGDFFKISTHHKHNSSDMQELKFPNTKISSTLHEEKKRIILAPKCTILLTYSTL